MFALGLFIGGFVGALVMSLMVIARESDERYLEHVGDDLAQRLRDEAGA